MNLKGCKTKVKGSIFLFQVTCLKDKGGEQSLPWSNLQISTKQVQERMNRAIARKKASVMQTNVSVEGQRAFIHLRKT